MLRPLGSFIINSSGDELDIASIQRCVVVWCGNVGVSEELGKTRRAR